MAAINPTATSPAVVKNHETIAKDDEPTTKTVGNATANALKADESMDVDPHEEDEHSESDTRSSSSGEVAVDNPSQDIRVSSVPCQYTRPKIFLLTRRKGDLEKVLTESEETDRENPNSFPCFSLPSGDAVDYSGAYHRKCFFELYAKRPIKS